MILIELIPRTSFFTNVRSEVSKDRWDYLRKQCYKKANYKCEICKGKGPKWPVECHEVWDYNYKTKVQKLKRLIALCPKCHQVKHFGLSTIRGLEYECKEHMKKVNKWSNKKVNNHIEDAFNTWNKRNKISWKLDLSHLDTL